MPSLESPRRLTELDAINLMLRNIGEDPVVVVGPTSRPTAQKAKEMLAEESINTQSHGYNFCTTMALRLSPNEDGEIALPLNILSFTPVEDSEHLEVGERGGRLFDHGKNTFKFDRRVTLRAVMALPFDELPQPAIWYIAMAASMRFANSENPGGASLRVTSEDVLQAKIALERYDKRLKRGGLRVNNRFIRRLRGWR